MAASQNFRSFGGCPCSKGRTIWGRLCKKLTKGSWALLNSLEECGGASRSWGVNLPGPSNVVAFWALYQKSKRKHHDKPKKYLRVGRSRWEPTKNYEWLFPQLGALNEKPLLAGQNMPMNGVFWVVGCFSSLRSRTQIAESLRKRAFQLQGRSFAPASEVLLAPGSHTPSFT